MKDLFHNNQDMNRRVGDPHVNGKLIQLIDPLHGRYLVSYDLRGHGDEMTYLIREFDHLPSTEEIVELIATIYNRECDEEIFSGSTYTTLEENPVTKPIRLSMENQFNWIVGYLLTVDFGGMNLPEFIKIGSDDDIYIYRIESIEQYRHFIMSNLAHVKSCLQRCWQRKNEIDLSKYTLD